jgi:hypothetical protein
VATGAGGTANTPASRSVGPALLVAILALTTVAARRRLRRSSG